MIRKSVKFLFSLLMVFSILAPMAVSYLQVKEKTSYSLVDAPEKEPSQESQKELAKEKAEKDWIVLDFSTSFWGSSEPNGSNAKYLLVQSVNLPSILPPPPEYRA